jgi:hypothetical protein
MKGCPEMRAKRNLVSRTRCDSYAASQIRNPGAFVPQIRRKTPRLVDVARVIENTQLSTPRRMIRLDLAARPEKAVWESENRKIGGSSHPPSLRGALATKQSSASSKQDRIAASLR